MFFAELIFLFPDWSDKRGSLNRPKHRYNLNRNKTSKANRSLSRREQIARLKTFSGGMLRAIGNTGGFNFVKKKVNWYCFCHSAPLHLRLISQFTYFYTNFSKFAKKITALVIVVTIINFPSSVLQSSRTNATKRNCLRRVSLSTRTLPYNL